MSEAVEPVFENVYIHKKIIHSSIMCEGGKNKNSNKKIRYSRKKESRSFRTISERSLSLA